MNEARIQLNSQLNTVTLPLSESFIQWMNFPPSSYNYKIFGSLTGSGSFQLWNKLMITRTLPRLMKRKRDYSLPEPFELDGEDDDDEKEKANPLNYSCSQSTVL